MPTKSDKDSSYSTLKPPGANSEPDSWRTLVPPASSGELLFDPGSHRSDVKPETRDIDDWATPSHNQTSPQNDEYRKFEHLERTTPRRAGSIKRDRIDKKLLDSEKWSHRPTHTLSYVGLLLFTVTMYFRPYELIPGLSGFTSMAFVIAIATLLVYLPTQISTEGSLTILNTETKCVLFLTLWALVTIPIAKAPGLAWKEFSETFLKVVIIFVVMVNVLRTRSRLNGIMLVGMAIGVTLSCQALWLYSQGKFAVEGYRVNVDFGGMFGNPNDMALHLVIFAPIALTLGLGTRNFIFRMVCYAAATMMLGGIVVTQSRGGFLGLLAVAFVLVWKLGKGKRLKVLLISTFLGLIFLTVLPGNYGTRVLSIFIPSLDPVGSADTRRDLLIRSILVTLRNPAGIGMANFTIVSDHEHVTHNAYTQVSAELGWPAFVAYILFLFSPLRKLGAIERRLLLLEDFGWIYFLSVGLQASIFGYLVSSFFASVAYGWYIYYPVAFAVCLRRLYQIDSAQSERNTLIPD